MLAQASRVVSFAGGSLRHAGGEGQDIALKKSWRKRAWLNAVEWELERQPLSRASGQSLQTVMRKAFGKEELNYYEPEGLCHECRQ
jgi:hypothetical protein